MEPGQRPAPARRRGGPLEEEDPDQDLVDAGHAAPYAGGRIPNLGGGRQYQESPLAPVWLRYHGVTAPDLEAIIEAVPQALDGNRLTREQLADELVRITKRSHLAEPLRVGWGALLKPSAFKGHLCFGPSEGQNVTFVRPDQWLGRWKPIETEKALAEVTRRYLHAYGPAKRDELAGWWGVRGPQARPMLASLGDEVEEVSVEGWRGWMLAGDVAHAARRWPEGSVRLLGNFDPLILLSAKYPGYTLKAPRKVQVYRKAGWVSPVLLVDGVIRGVWALDKSGGTIQLVPFEALTPQIRRQLAPEIEAIAGYLGREVDLRMVRALTPVGTATP